MKKLLVILSTISILFGTMVGASASPPPTVVVIDTGIDMTNPAVSNRVVAEVCITRLNFCPNGKNFMEGTGSATLNPTLALNNGFYHGTQMAGIIVENSNANIIMIRVIGMNANGTRASSDITVFERSLQWVVANKEKYNISAVSISQNIKSTTTCMNNKIVEDSVAVLKSINVPVVSSSGNDYNYVVANFPACVKDVISIGATELPSAKGQFPSLYSNISDDFYLIGRINTYINSTTKANSVGTSNATALMSARWVNEKLTFQETYNKFKSVAVVTSTKQVGNVLVIK